MVSEWPGATSSRVRWAVAVSGTVMILLLKSLAGEMALWYFLVVKFIGWRPVVCLFSVWGHPLTGLLIEVYDIPGLSLPKSAGLNVSSWVHTDIYIYIYIYIYVEYINEGEGTNLPYRKIPDNKCGRKDGNRKPLLEHHCNDCSR